MSTQPKKPDVLDFDERFQENIVRLLHQDSGFAEAALEHLTPAHFENPIHAWTVRTMRQCYNVNGFLPDGVVLKQERRKAERLGTIRKEDVPAYRSFLAKKLHRPVANRTYIKRELQQFVKHQAVKNFILDAVDNLLPQHKWDELDSKMARTLDFDLTGDFSIGERPGETWKKRMRAREQTKEAGITTGIAELDRLMVRGGMTPKQLGTVIAPTGRGKTNFLINLAASAVLDNIPTLYITLELDAETIMDRFDARFTGVSLKDLRTETRTLRRAYRKVAKRVSRNLVVKEFPPGTTTVNTLKQHIRKLERIGFYPKLIVIDYADLLKPRIEFADSSYETQGQVYLDILGMLAELKIVGWTATQGNRKSMDADVKGDVDLSMMADSMKKAFLAFVVLGLAQSVKEKKFRKGRVVILKNRNGPADRELKISIEHDVVTFRSV